MQTLEVTDDEKDLIEVLRNYRKAYPNGSFMMELEIQELVERLKGNE